MKCSNDFDYLQHINCVLRSLLKVSQFKISIKRIELDTLCKPNGRPQPYDNI